MKGKVLIVEDEAMLALVYKKALEFDNYQVSCVVDTGKEAIIKTEEFLPDLILMDIMLNGEMDGIEAAIEIKEKFGIAIIYLTGNTDLQTKTRALKTNPLKYIEKPIDSETLCEIINNLSLSN